MGVSVEDTAALDRVDDLRDVPTAVRFLSCEPLLSSLAGLDLSGIGWVIAGGESGIHARPAQPPWITELRDTCTAAQVPFFFKQWSGRTPKAGGRMLDAPIFDHPSDIVCAGLGRIGQRGAATRAHVSPSG
jgi:protein gp37